MFGLTKQEWFDKAVERAKIKEKSLDSLDSSCLYNGINNPGCFIGAGVPKEQRHILIEGIGASEHVSMHILSVPDLDDREAQGDFLEGLQDIHDTVMVDEWDARLRTFGKKNELEVK